MNIRPGYRYQTVASLALGLVLLTSAVGSLFGKSKGGSSSDSSSGKVHVNGYTRKDGTYVAPYTRTSPNSTKSDNWSTKGNINPITGKPGTKKGDAGESGNSQPAPRAEPALPSGANTTGDMGPTETQPQHVEASWKSVTPGMSKSEVLKLLGEPNIKTDQKWVYSKRGTLIFTTQGQLQGIKP